MDFCFLLETLPGRKKQLYLIGDVAWFVGHQLDS